MSIAMDESTSRCTTAAPDVVATAAGEWRQGGNPIAPLPMRARIAAALVTAVGIPAVTVPWVATDLSAPNLVLLGALTLWSGARLVWLATAPEPRFASVFVFVFVFVFVAVSSCVQAVTGRFPTDNLDYSQAALNRHLLALTIGVLAFEVGQQLAHRVRDHVTREPQIEHPSVLLGLSPHRLLLLGLVGCSFVALQVSRHGVVAFFVSRDQTSALLSGYTGAVPLYMATDKSGGLINTFLAQYLVFVSLYLILYARHRGMWETDAVIGRWGWRIVIAVLAAANLVMNNPAGNGRYWFCTIAVCFASVYVPVHTRRNVILYVGAAIAILLLAFSFLDYFRMTDRTVQVGVERGLTTVSYPVLQTGLNGERYIELNGHTYGRQLEGALLGFVPRRVWPDKAIDTGQIIDPQYARSASAWTEMQVDFGLPGVVGLFALWGAGAVAVDRRLASPRPGVVPAFLVLASIFQLFLLRGSFLSGVATLYQLAFLFLCAVTFTRVHREGRE